MAESGEAGGEGEGRERYEESGLCDRCLHAEILRSKRSRFLRCRLADADPRFAKYPRLPVAVCDGWVAYGAGRRG